MQDQTVAILHYSAPPIVGGVEAVIKAHQNDDEKEVDWGVLITGSNIPAALSLAKHLEENDTNARFFDNCNLARFYNMSVVVVKQVGKRGE